LTSISRHIAAGGGGGGDTPTLVHDDDFSADTLANYESPGTIFEGNADTSVFTIAGGALRGANDANKMISPSGLSLVDSIQQIECRWKDEGGSALFGLGARLHTGGAKTLIGGYQNQTGIRTYGWLNGVFGGGPTLETGHAPAEGAVTFLHFVCLGAIAFTFSTDYDPLTATGAVASSGWNGVNQGYPSGIAWPQKLDAGPVGIVMQGNGQVPASGDAHEILRYRVWSLD
jgi:hypothetical protein